MKILPIVALALSASLAQAEPHPLEPPPSTSQLPPKAKHPAGPEQPTPANPTPTQPAPATPITPEMSSADVTNWLGFFDELVATVVADQNTCEKMATDVSAVIDRHHDSLRVARRARLRHEKLPEAAQQHMLDGVKRMGPGIENCGNNDHVKQAFSKLDTEHQGAAGESKPPAEQAPRTTPQGTKK